MPLWRKLLLPIVCEQAGLQFFSIKGRAVLLLICVVSAHIMSAEFVSLVISVICKIYSYPVAAIICYQMLYSI